MNKNKAKELVALNNCLAEHGKIILIKSGMDCDCCQFSYRCEFATVDEALSYMQSEYEAAEGTLYFAVHDAELHGDFKDSSRDLALEAFEDGHPHVVYGM